MRCLQSAVMAEGGPLKELGREYKNTLEKLSAVKLELMEERPMSDAVAEALTNGE